MGDKHCVVRERLYGNMAKVKGSGKELCIAPAVGCSRVLLGSGFYPFLAVFIRSPFLVSTKSHMLMNKHMPPGNCPPLHFAFCILLYCYFACVC